MKIIVPKSLYTWANISSPKNGIADSRGMWIFILKIITKLISKKDINFYSINNVLECLLLHTLSNKELSNILCESI